MHSNFFARKTKKNGILFRYLRNYDYFCQRYYLINSIIITVSRNILLFSFVVTSLPDVFARTEGNWWHSNRNY